MTEDIKHYGTPRHSGRYPWGSGGDPYQRNSEFLKQVEILRKQGLSNTEIARGLGMTTTEFRARSSIAKNEKRKDDEMQAMRLKEKGMSNVAIGERMGINESSVRSLLNPAMQAKADALTVTSDMLKDRIGPDGFLDVGVGTEASLGISRTRLNTAVAALKEQGYTEHYIKEPQVGMPDQYTTIKVLAPPGTSYSEVYNNKDKIKSFNVYSEDGGNTYQHIKPPVSVDSKRIDVRYAEDGGASKDGVIELRRGIDDISLGGSNYAQVRIAVDGTHYLKGMAMYSDNLPPGVDMLFNTNKSSTGNKLDAMKNIKDDPDNPFGSYIKRQRTYIDADGNERQSVMNLVNEEGDWAKWSKTLSSQMLSKQSPALAKQQLGELFDRKKAEYDEIMSLTNPAVKKRLLEAFSDSCDSASVHLKAAALPRQKSQVILPINSLKDNEVYAPNFKPGETVVLIRFPHGGTFEIPELKVNNRNKEGRDILGAAKDAIGINSKVAARLSGADFDGDTVLVIPNNNKSVKTSSSLLGLRNFDPQIYKMDPSEPKMKAKTKQQEMGKISNLITDMTIGGAIDSELARAVRHSMVVIDAEKHHLNYKKSAVDNGIDQLKKKYQANSSKGGASTLISRSSAEIRIAQRAPRKASEGGPIDILTGKKEYTYSGETYNRIGKNGKITVVPKTNKSTRMAETSNAFTLSSGTVMESVYATHANKLKAMANDARKTMVTTKPIAYSPSANKTYAPQVATLKGKLNVALKNAPLERQAQLLANSIVSTKLKANPDVDRDDIKKVKGMALTTARARVGAKKTAIEITTKEWQAIQAGAISNNMLNNILRNADLDKVKELAMPKTKAGMSATKIARAKSMLRNGHTQSDIADALGVSVSTLSNNLK